jgi:hypothetical protein
MPGLILDHFQAKAGIKNPLSCPPPCTLCHVNPTPPPEDLKGADATTDLGSHRGLGVFVSNMLGMPPAGNIQESAILIQKIDSMEKAPCNPNDTADKGACDSDGDNVPDYVEVSTGKDPDEKGDGSSAICPTYGCGASIGTLPHRSSDTGRAGAMITALGVAFVLARRFRR